jgi:transposase
VIGQCLSRHRHQGFLKFLKTIDEAIPEEEGVTIHVMMDNYATHKTLAVQRWFARHPRYHVHFTPTSASWLNMVERFFCRNHDEENSSRNVPEREAPGEIHREPPG